MIQKRIVTEIIHKYEKANYQNKVAFFYLGIPFFLLGIASIIISYKICQVTLND